MFACLYTVAPTQGTFFTISIANMYIDSLVDFLVSFLLFGYVFSLMASKSQLNKHPPLQMIFVINVSNARNYHFLVFFFPHLAALAAFKRECLYINTFIPIVAVTTPFVEESLRFAVVQPGVLFTSRIDCVTPLMLSLDVFSYAMSLFKRMYASRSKPYRYIWKIFELRYVRGLFLQYICFKFITTRLFFDSDEIDCWVIKVMMRLLLMWKMFDSTYMLRKKVCEQIPCFIKNYS